MGRGQGAPPIERAVDGSQHDAAGCAGRRLRSGTAGIATLTTLGLAVWHAAAVHGELLGSRPASRTGVCRTVVVSCCGASSSPRVMLIPATAYGQHWAFCLETQHFPNAVNEPKFESVVVPAGKRTSERTVFRFGWDK